MRKETLCRRPWNLGTAKHIVLVQMRLTSLKLPFLLKLTRNFWTRTKLGIFAQQVPNGVEIL